MKNQFRGKSVALFILFALMTAPLTFAADGLDSTLNEQTILMSQQAQRLADQARQIAGQNDAFKEQVKEIAKQAKAITKQVAVQRVEKNIHQVVQQAMKMAKNIQICQDNVYLAPPVPAVPVIPAVPSVPSANGDEKNFKVLHSTANILRHHVPSANEDEKNFKGEIVSATIDKVFDVNAETKFKSDTSFSAIHIVPGDSNKISVHIFKKAGANTKEEAQQILNRIQVTCEQKDNVIELTVEIGKEGSSETHQNSMMKCDIVVQVPENTPVELRNSFGDVLIEKIHASLDAANKFGSLFLKDTAGALNASAEYGLLSITTHQGNGQVKTKFGDLTINGLTGKLDASCEYGKAEIQTGNKELQLEGNFSFGDLNLVLPTDYSGTVTASSSFGEINAPELLKKKKEMFNESVEGSIGDGKGKVHIQSKYSPVRISLGKSE